MSWLPAEADEDTWPGVKAHKMRTLLPGGSGRVVESDQSYTLATVMTSRWQEHAAREAQKPPLSVNCNCMGCSQP
ncbi:hypothetical protein Pyn_19779 [Prunus yedoensis var. nudiflora]|uniref:Uncharacterized protein n=1 Tax=Prunus yedoensis var. nudiflora TaxID=2094558 RepID=A0A314Z390_PRUYE|nr:hypothetical protein Pyn_19779 [Prunus yedoensis var. nudiflora]